MSSALGYYATQKRASDRLENKRNEISRASAYILDSGSSRTGSNNYSSSYSSNSTNNNYSSNSTNNYSSNSTNNYSSDVGRAGRGRYRDTSTDYSAKLSRRSSSLEIGAVKLRNRDVSTDLSYKRDFSSSTRPSRPVTRNYDGEEHSDEYKKIMSSSDKYLTMAKYSSSNGEAKEVNSVMEEERRSKAYSKIIGAQTAQSLETDSGRATLTDIFCNTSGFSAKTVQAIYKETLYKDGEKPKNYSWRKDMEAYEDNLEKMTEHKKTVRESTKATRDVVSYKSTDDKIRDYERESRRNVDTDAPIIRRNADIVLETKPLASSTPSYRSSALVQDSYEEPKTESVRGNWRKDMAKFEDSLTTKKRESQVVTVKPTATVSTVTKPVEKTTQPVIKAPEIAKVEVKPAVKSEPVKPEVKAPAPKVETPKTEVKPTVTKPEPAKMEVKPAVPKTEVKTSAPTTPVASKPEPEKKVEEKPSPKWKKPAATVAAPKEEPKPAETPKTTPKWKKPTPAAPKEEPKPVEAPKPTPKWKKPATAAPKEEPKPAEPEKPVPKWKNPATAAPKEEPKPAEPAPVEKEKTPEPVKEPEPVVEEPVVAAPEPEPVKEPEPVVEEPVVAAPAPAPEPAQVEAEPKPTEEKKEGEGEEEEEDVTGMRAMRKEQQNKFTDMEQEFAAGASKLSALRAKMRALRMKSKASSEADAEADRQRQG